MDVPTALQKVGGHGRYQLFVMIFLCLFWIDISYMLLGPSYIFMNPTFHCSTLDGIVQQNDACPILSQCQLVDKFTITAKVELYCERQFERNLVQSSMYIGSISGLVIMNLVSDRKGRKFSFMISSGLTVIGTALLNVGAFASSIVTMIFAQIFIGFGAYACLTISYILMSDLFDDKLRQIGIITVNAAWAIGQVSFFVLYNYLPDWQYFTIGCLLIPLIGWFVIGWFLLVESPVYLNEYSREKCVESLNRIAAWNGTETVRIEEIEINAKVNEDVSAFQVFKKWSYVKIIILVSVFEVTTNMFYYGTQYSMEDIGSNFGTNLLIVGCLEFTAYFTSNFFVQKIKRKKSMMLLNLVAGGLGCLFIIPPLASSKIFQIIIVPFSRFLLTYCQGILALFMNESFPDRVKSSGSGTIEALSNIGNLITPFIVSLTINLGINSVFVVSVILLLGVVALVPTRQTYHAIAKEGDDSMKESLLSGSEEPIENKVE